MPSSPAHPMSMWTISRLSRRSSFGRCSTVPSTSTSPTPLTARRAISEQGQIVIDRSDIVIAVWDGRETGLRAGTAPGVDRARIAGVPLVLIDPGNPDAWHMEPGRGLPQDELSEVDAFNRASLAEEPFGRASRQREEHLRIPGAEWAAALIEWHLPMFVRADTLANRYRKLYHAFSDALFLFGALALVAVGTQLVFFPDRPGVASVEVALLVMLLIVLLAGRRLKLHDRSVAYRFLAERLRASLFLAAVGATPGDDGHPFLLHDAERWPRRAFRLIWEARPRVMAPPEASDSARRFLLDGWVREQLEYFARSERRHERRLRLLDSGIIALFGVTVILALVHAVGAGHNEHGATAWARVATSLTVALPAFAVAFAGIRTQRDHARNELRYAHMRERLEDAKERLEQPLTVDQLSLVAQELDAGLLNENRDWLFAMLIQGKPELGA